MVKAEDADRAVTAVMRCIGHYADPQIRKTMDTRRPRGGAGDLFVLLDERTWITDVTNYYNSFFQDIVGGDLEGVLRGCKGFTTPLSHSIRRLFVPTTSNYGTLVHECVHWLQHTNAYPAFYKGDRQGPLYLEGVTEYFTRRVHAGGRTGHYEGPLQVVERALLAKKTTEDELAGWAFRGEAFPAGLRVG